MRYLTVSEVLLVHRRLLAQTGGGTGVRSMGVVESAVAQPQATFGGAELYPTLIEKAVALSFALIQGHGFVDGNKRVAHAALEVFLILNGYELIADVDVQEQFFLRLAGGKVTREAFIAWLTSRVVQR
ncbi:unnamed protein product [Laminaria digitata]